MSTQELVAKWKPLLEYVSEDCPALPKEKWFFVAQCMEDVENKYLLKGDAEKEFQENRCLSRLLKVAIPATRREEGPVLIEETETEYIVHAEMPQPLAPLARCCVINDEQTYNDEEKTTTIYK